MDTKEIIENGENGEIQVQVAPIGQFNGSDAKGNPVPENLTPESLEALADKLNNGDEVLCDVDHQSCRPGVEKDTSSAGWFSKFIIDPIKGLLATLKLTKKGRELVQSREYRYLSPTFMLNDDGTPQDLHSVSLTNLPAFKGKIEPILNTEPTKDIIEMEMTKEDLIALIKETVLSMNTEAPIEEKQEEVLNSCPTEAKNEEAEAEEKKEETAEVENSCEEKEEEAKNEEPTEVVEEKKEEEKEEEQKVEEEVVEEKEEVIKKEALNSAPTPGYADTIQEPWKKLHGKEFFDWLSKHKSEL